MCTSVFAQAKTDTRAPLERPRYLRGAYIMNHKKLLLTLTLCLCALLCMVVTASASEVQGHTNHFSCGVAGCRNNDHSHTQVTEWQPWTGPQSASEDNIPYDSNTKTAYIYLTDNVQISDALTIPRGHTLYLCLNGKTISYNGAGIFASNGGGLIYIAGGAALTICDCQNTGCIKYEKAQSSDQISTIHSWGTLNLYGGTISRMNTNNNGHTIRTRGESKFNMYGGTVSNDGATPALCLENDANIYGGEITCTGDRGIHANGSSDTINLLVAGGTISAGEKEAIDLSATVLTLSGQPTITSAGTDSAVIDAGANIIKIADSFAPAHCISVSQSGDNDTFAEPVEGGASLADKAQYFTSFESGKFVAYDNGTLKFTACAITQQPTKDNSYTVKGNAPDSKLSYQWYAAQTQKGDIPVTDAVARKGENADYYSWGWKVPCDSNGVDCFTLYMNEGDVLTLSRILGGWDTKVSISDRTVQESDDGTYTFTAPVAGEYTLKISARAFIVDDSNVPDRSDLSFEAALRTLVPDTAKPAGGTAAALDTAGLSAGKYICQVTWEGKSTLNSGIVQFSGNSQQPTGSGSYYYAPSAAEGKKDSPKTADPGVLLYAGLALTSLAGLACTAKKRH